MSLLTSLGSVPRTIPGEAGVVDAAQEMAHHHVGSLVVLKDGQPCGLITDRDLALTCLQLDGDYSKTPVMDCASTPLRTVPADSSAGEATAAMRRYSVRRLGLTGPDGELVGVLSMDDLIRQLGLLGQSVTDTVNREFREERNPSASSTGMFGPE